LGAKGLGELTAVSVAPAIANAVYHATGKRVRDLPITIEKVL
jgi:xanthine dehydrogenase YagR molybdenum-binding subunit